MAQFGEELAFLKTQALVLQNIAVIYPNDYQPALEDVPRKVLPFQIAVLPPPVRFKSQASQAAQSADPSSFTSTGRVSLTIKSTKPALTFSLSAHPTDTIAQIKQQLAKEHPRAPASDDQRLLLKGKVLADNKLLKEYPIPTTGTDIITITLMSKPGSHWTGEEKMTSSPSITPPPPTSTVVSQPAQVIKPAATNLARPSAGHVRSMSGAADEMPVPSLTLSPTPDVSPKGNPAMQLDMDLNMISDPPRAMTPTAQGFYEVVKDPEFWQSLFEFLTQKFKTPEDAQQAWEEFFLTSKSHLTPNEIAKIRDVTGLVAMAGF